MPEDEGLALHEAGLDGGRVGPLLEIGSYCGKSAVYLGSAALEVGTVAVHDRPPPRLGGEPGRVGAPRHRGRRPAHRPHGHAAVLPAHDRGRRARGRGRRDRRRLADRRPVLADAASASCSSTAATPRTSRWPTTTAGPGHVAPGGVLAIHDVFEDPDDGGQAPVPRLAARGRRRLHPDRHHRQPPHPPPLTPAAIRRPLRFGRTTTETQPSGARGCDRPPSP